MTEDSIKSASPSSINKDFKIGDFSKDVIIYAFGNGLLLLFALIKSFIIPKYLSIEGYGYWQTFALYASYTGLLHIGFADGILMRFAGKDIDEIGDDISTAFKFLLIQQIAVVVPLAILFHFIFSYPLHDIFLLLLAYALAENVFTFFTYVGQSIRKFSPLTAIYVARGALFLILIVIFLLLKRLDYVVVIYCFVLSFFLCLALFVYWFRHYLWKSNDTIKRIWKYGLKNINVGIYILCGNFIVVLFLTIDRLMVNSFFSIEQFAFYAFALAVVIVAYTFIKAVSDVFFPYISGSHFDSRTGIYSTGKNILILSGAIALMLYFPLVKLIEIFLPRYVDSLMIIRILVGTVGFSSIIQILHVNYYKLFGKQKLYFLWGIIALAIAVVLNLLAIKIWSSLLSVAVATLISFVIWYILNEFSLRRTLDIPNKEIFKGIAAIILYLGAFWISIVVDFLLWQFFIYTGLCLVITALLLRRETKLIVSEIINHILKRITGFRMH